MRHKGQVKMEVKNYFFLVFSFLISFCNSTKPIEKIILQKELKNISINNICIDKVKKERPLLNILLTKTSINSEDFKSLLKSSLIEIGYTFNDYCQSNTTKVNVQLFELESKTFFVPHQSNLTCKIGYEVIEEENLIYEKKIITNGKAASFERWVGTFRFKLARDRCVKANLILFLEDLSKLEIQNRTTKTKQVNKK